jgi:hypothetical protein
MKHMEESALDKKIKATIEEAKAMKKKPDGKKYAHVPNFLDNIKTKEQAELFKLIMKSLH